MLKKKILSIALNIALISNIFTINSFATNTIDSNTIDTNTIDTNELTRSSDKLAWITNLVERGSKFDYLYGAEKTSDGGIVVVGETNSNFGTSIPDDFDAYIAKFDANGNRIFAMHHGGDGHDVFENVIPTSDGGYIAVGYTDSSIMGSSIIKGGYDGLIVKVDRYGYEEWTKTWGGTNEDLFYDIAQLSDGSFIVVGETSSSQAGFLGGQAVIVKYDNKGNVLFEESFGGNLRDCYFNVVAVSDGFVVTGISESTDLSVTIQGGYDGIISKYNNNGTQQWIKSWGGTGYDWLYDIIATSDGGYVVVGETSSINISGITNNGYADGVIVKYNSSGTQQWAKTWGGSAYDGFGAVSEIANGQFIVVGHSESANTEYVNKGQEDGIILKYNNSGNMISINSIGGSGTDTLQDIVCLSNTSYYVAGYTDSENISPIFVPYGEFDILVAKYNGTVIETTPPTMSYTLSPSSWTNGNVTINITATDDSGVKEITLPNGNIVSSSSTSYTVSANGIYTFKATDMVGNIGTLNVSVSKIDNIPPILNIYESNE